MDIALISIGPVGNTVKQVCNELENDKIQAAHYDIRYLKPIDAKLLHEVLSNFNKIVTIEDGTTIGGLGSAVLEFMSEHRYSAEVRLLGVPDRFIEHGAMSELQKECGFDAEGIRSAVYEMIDK